MQIATHFHAMFKQHGRGNMRMQARAVLGFMQHACGPFRHRTPDMDRSKQKTSIYQTNRGNWRTCGGEDAEKVWGYARRALLVQPAWSRKPTYASRSRAKLHHPVFTDSWLVSRPLIKANGVSGPLRRRTLSHGKTESSKPADQRCNSVPCNGLYGARG